MNTLNVLSFGLGGGLFALLVFWHFIADWPLQSEKEAIAKAENFWVRWHHVWVYTTLFMPFFWFVGFWNMQTIYALVFLWVTHFFIDTYWPVFMWAKYLRRADQFNHVKLYGMRADGSYAMSEKDLQRMMNAQNIPNTLVVTEKVEVTYATDREAFKAFFMTPIGGLLCITIDQLCHIACLLPVVWLMMGR